MVFLGGSDCSSWLQPLAWVHKLLGVWKQLWRRKSRHRSEVPDHQRDTRPEGACSGRLDQHHLLFWTNRHSGSRMCATEGRVSAEEIGIGAGAVTALVISLRYSAAQPHYHVFTVPLAAWIVAHGTHILMERRTETTKSLMLVLALLAVGYLPAIRDRVSYVPEAKVLRLAELATRLRSIADPGDLIVVRSLDRAYDPKYKRRNNFEDPRGFYLTGLRGWVLPADRAEVDKLSVFAKRGARFYVEVAPRLDDPALMTWLLSSGETVINDEDGIILHIGAAGMKAGTSTRFAHHPGKKRRMAGGECF